jgi:hypothetical protein
MNEINDNLRLIKLNIKKIIKNYGDWGLGPIPNPHPQSPIPNPQSPF